MKKNLSFLVSSLIAAGIIACSDEGSNVSSVQSEASNVDITSLAKEGTVTVSKDILPDLLVAARKDGLSLRLLNLTGDKATVRFERKKVSTLSIGPNQPLEKVLARYTCADPGDSSRLRSSLARYTCADPGFRASFKNSLNQGASEDSLKNMFIRYTCAQP